MTAVAFLDPRDAAFTCVVGQGAVPPAAARRGNRQGPPRAACGGALRRRRGAVAAAAAAARRDRHAPPAPDPRGPSRLRPHARPVEASHVDGDVVRRSVAPHVYLRKLARARAFATLRTHAALSAMVSSGDTRIDALVTVAAARRHRRQRRRAREAVRMASRAAARPRRSSGVRGAAPGDAGSAARCEREPLSAAARARGAAERAGPGRARAAVLGVAPPATPPPSQRSPDAGPRSAPELPARRWGRLGPRGGLEVPHVGTTTAAAATSAPGAFFVCFFRRRRRPQFLPWRATPPASAGLCEPPSLNPACCQRLESKKYFDAANAALDQGPRDGGPRRRRASALAARSAPTEVLQGAGFTR